MSSNITASTGQSVTMLNMPGLPDPAPRGYSHVAVASPGHRAVHIAGQAGENEAGELSTDFREQVQQTVRNLELALRTGGARFADVAKVTVLMVDISFERMIAFNDELNKAFAPHPLPASTLIPVHRLADERMLIEVDAVAYIPA